MYKVYFKTTQSMREIVNTISEPRDPYVYIQELCTSGIWDGRNFYPPHQILQAYFVEEL